MSLILTTFAAILVTAAVAAEVRIAESRYTEWATDLQTIKKLNLLIQRAHLMEPGSGTIFIMHWSGRPAELMGNGNCSTVTFPTVVATDQESLRLQDPAGIIRSVQSNGTHMIVEYNIGMNNLTLPTGDIVLVIKRNYDGIRLHLRP